VVVYALAKGVAITRHRASSARKPGVATFGPARLDPATVAKLWRRNDGGGGPVALAQYVRSSCVAVARSLSTSTWLGRHRLSAPLPIAFALTKAEWGPSSVLFASSERPKNMYYVLYVQALSLPIARHQSELREGYHQYAG
jgi:hypothetical protein